MYVRNDNPLSRQPLLRWPPCSATVCLAAGQRRAMSSWHGCVRALDGLENYARLLAAGEKEFKTKPQIALDQILAAQADGVPQGVVLADAGYGINTAFRTELTEMGS
jgi:SRSO17 transposase